MADWLDIAQATYVNDIESVDEKQIVVKRRLEHGFERVACKMPALLTVISELNEPRYPHMGQLISACEQKSPITVWNAADIGVKTIEVGLEGSNTHVIKTFTPNFKRQNELLKGSNKEVVSDLIDRLKKSDTTIAYRL